MRIRDIVEKEGRDQGHPLSHLISLVLQIQTQVTVHQIIEGRSIDTKRPVTVLKYVAALLLHICDSLCLLQCLYVMEISYLFWVPLYRYVKRDLRALTE